MHVLLLLRHSSLHPVYVRAQTFYRQLIAFVTVERDVGPTTA